MPSTSWKGDLAAAIVLVLAAGAMVFVLIGNPSNPAAWIILALAVFGAVWAGARARRHYARREQQR